jgi:hypothetical protein
MQNIDEQKIKLAQKKNRLAAEEIKFKIKERKMRTRHLIEVGGLILKAGLGTLPTNTLYGALLSLAKSLESNLDIKHNWTIAGKNKLDQEQQNKIPIILKFDEQPDNGICKSIRSFDLKWNKLRKEWYGYITDIESLKENLARSGIKYNLEIIKNSTNT